MYPYISYELRQVSSTHSFQGFPVVLWTKDQEVAGSNAGLLHHARL